MKLDSKIVTRLVYAGILILLTMAFLFVGFYREIESNYARISSGRNKKGKVPTSFSTKSRNTLIGPRGNVPDEAPADNGFSSFAILVPGVISRSGQPSMTDFLWLKNHGWKSIINVRTTDDGQNQWFNEMDFNYLHVGIRDGSVPTDDQVELLLKFMTNPNNFPFHVHCRIGAGRTSLVIALYRYMVQRWPMEDAIGEARLFNGLNGYQEEWLRKWAHEHRPICKGITCGLFLPRQNKSF